MNLREYFRKATRDRLFVLFLASFSVCIFCYLFNMAFILLLVCALLSIYIVYRSKFSIFSLKILLLDYVLIALSFQRYLGHSYGLLELGIVELHFLECVFIASLYIAIESLLISRTNILDLEERAKASFIRMPISKKVILLFSAFAIIFAFIAFPPSLMRDGRFDSLLPGHAWNHCCVIALIFLLASARSNKKNILIILLCSFWFLFQGERVDMIGVIIGALIVYSGKANLGEKSAKRSRGVIMLIAMFSVLVFMVFVGEFRQKNYDISFKHLFQKIAIQSTAADVGYVYNSSIDYVKKYGLSFGSTYSSYLIEALPLLNSNNSAGQKIKSSYLYPGGILLLSEPYMNFGALGIIVFSVLEFAVLYVILKSTTTYSKFLYVYILIATFRITWYGISYIETGVLYILPIMYLIYRHLAISKDGALNE